MKNYIKKVNFKRFFIALVCFSMMWCLVSCESIIQTSCSHEYEVSDEEKADLFNDGYTRYRCSKCGDTYTRDNGYSFKSYADNWSGNIIRRIKEDLKDPDSLQYELECYCPKEYEDADLSLFTEDNYAFVFFCVKWNAKNSFGGYDDYEYSTYEVRMRTTVDDRRGYVNEVNYINLSSNDSYVLLFTEHS